MSTNANPLLKYLSPATDDPNQPLQPIQQAQDQQGQLQPINARTAPAQASPLAQFKPNPVRQQTESYYQGRLDKLNAPTPPAHGFWGKTGRILENIGNVAGDIFAPATMALIPGTQLNKTRERGSDVRELSGLQAQDQQDEEQFNKTQQEQGQQPLREAQTREANARADSLENPQDKPDQFTFQQTDHGLMRIDSVTGEATPVTYQGQPLQPKPVQEKGIVTDLKVGGKEHNVLIDPTTGRQISDLGERGEKPVQGPGITVVTPEGTIQRLAPGQSMVPGSMSPTQLGAQNAAGVKEGKADAKASQNLDNELGLMRQFAANPSPTNDVAMLMHYIGATKPESMGKIRLNERELTLFGGTRSSLGDAEALLEKVTNGQSLTPKQRGDMVNTMSMIAQAAKRGPQAQQGDQPKEGQTKTNSHGDTITYKGGKWVIQ